MTEKTSYGFLHFLKKEPVLSISAICAVISAFFVPPSAAYVDYIDFRVLALLFCLMAVVAGLQRYGLFTWLAKKMLSGKKQRRTLFLLLILLPFFSSMLVTNDVALITFVPFAILILGLTGQEKYMIFVIVMQTVAANLGSMATPVGNPQNLFLYSRYSLSAGEFFAAVLPYALLSLPLLAVSVLFCPKEEISVSLPEEKEDINIVRVKRAHGVERGRVSDIFHRARVRIPRGAAFLCHEKSEGLSYGIKKDRIIFYLILFVLCLLSVFHVLHWGILLAIVCIALFIADKALYRTMDYGLLLTFVCFFIFSGNLGAIDSIKTVLQELLQKQPLLTSALASQVISNVPAAVLLSAFTEDWKALLLGTDLGGLGTPIASLASLISLRLYMKAEGASAGKFLLFFSVVNFVGLALLLGIAMVF